MCARVHLKSQGAVGGLGVPDQAGGHGAGAPTAPLQVAHGVVVQVAGRHQGAAGAHASWGELHAALCRQETEREHRSAPADWVSTGERCDLKMVVYGIHFPHLKTARS